MVFKSVQLASKSQFSIQRFIDLHSLKIQPQKFLEELQYSNNLDRNNNFYHDEFLRTFKKYSFNQEEIDSIQIRQSSFFQDIQTIADLKLRPTKAEKEFSRRDRTQNQLTKQIKEKIVKKNDLERQLFACWLKINNRLIGHHPSFDIIAQKQKPRINYHFLDLQKGIPRIQDLTEQQILIDSFLKELDSKYKNQNIQNNNSEINDFENYFNKPNLNHHWFRFQSEIGQILQFYFDPLCENEKSNNYSIQNSESYESFHFTNDISQTILQQYQLTKLVYDRLQKIFPHLKLNLWLVHSNNLHPFEASRIEITALNDRFPGEFSISSSSNFLDYFSLRYGQKEQYIIQLKINFVGQTIPLYDIFQNHY